MKHQIVFLTSHPMSLIAFMLPHIRTLNNYCDVRVIANTKDQNLLKHRGINVSVEELALVRPIDLWKDLKALWILYRRLKQGTFSAIHTVTPKAGLLGMLAAWAARVPCRIHSFTGQVWSSKTGLKRGFLKYVDKLIVLLATEVLIDSHAQRAFLIDEAVVTEKKSSVLGYGSICGVNTERFRPDSLGRAQLRSKMGTPSGALVCLYLGRLNEDKGLLDLSRAFAAIARSNQLAELWVIGPDEDDVFQQMTRLLNDVQARVKRKGYTEVPEKFMQAADILCLPSYREGFGSCVIEAAACGVPALVSRIYGLSDAVVEGTTGWMHEAGNELDLADKLSAVLSEPKDLKRVGLIAKARVESKFSEQALTSAMLELYKHRLGIN